MLAKNWRRRSILVAALGAVSPFASGSDFIVPAGPFNLGPSWSGGNVPGTTDDANINNGGVARIFAGDTLNIGRLRMGVDPGQVGSVFMEGGTLNVTMGAGNPGDQAVLIGGFGGATFTMNDGTIRLGDLTRDDGDFHIGKDGAAGALMTQNGGFVYMGGTLRVARGQGGSSNGTLSIQGGEFSAGEGVVVARGNNTSPTGTLLVGGKGKLVAGNSQGDGNAAGYSGEGFVSMGNLPNANGNVVVEGSGVIKAKRLTGRQGHGNLTIRGGGQFLVVNDVGVPTQAALYGSFLGGGSNSNGDNADGGTGVYSLLLRDQGLLDVDNNAYNRDTANRPDLQGFILARGNSTVRATVQDNARFVVRQRLVIGGMGKGADFSGFDGQPNGGTDTGGTATVTMTGGTISADHLIVGGSGVGTLSASGGRIETKPYRATYDPNNPVVPPGPPLYSVDSVRIGMFPDSKGTMNLSGKATLETGGDLSIGQYGSAALKVTGGDVTIKAKDVYVRKFAGASASVVAEITGATHSTIHATDNVKINGGAFSLVPTAVPANGARVYNIFSSDAGLLGGKFDTVGLPAGADAIGRVWSSFYTSKVFAVGLTRPGDADYNGAINFSDLVKLAQHYNAGGQWIDGDFTGDGTVNFADLVKLAQNYNTNVPAAVPGAPAGFDGDLAAAFASVPEPGVLSLFVPVAVAMTTRRRRRC